jgi:hypothetical protein
MGERRGVYRAWWEQLRERDNLEEPGVDGRIILRWIFRKWDVGAWTGSRWKCGNETSGSIKRGEFLD